MKKIIFCIFTFLILNGCTQYSSLVGPTYTVATTGNIYQASFAYTSGTMIRKQTGKDSYEHISYFIKKLDDSKKINQELIKLVETQINKTREIISSK
jgi:SLT domain-containing protein